MEVSRALAGCCSSIRPLSRMRCSVLASLAVLGNASAMLVLDEGNLAVADLGPDGVLPFESASVSRAVLKQGKPCQPTFAGCQLLLRFVGADG